jgi:hypothetical protein
VLDETSAIATVNFVHFVPAYALAAIPARYALERGRWADAAILATGAGQLRVGPVPPGRGHRALPRAIGAARSGDMALAGQSVARLEVLRHALASAKTAYWADQVEIQQRAAAGLLAQAEGRLADALALLRSAAALEAATDNHPVTPGPIVPAREMLAETFLTRARPRTRCRSSRPRWRWSRTASAPSMAERALRTWPGTGTRPGSTPPH